AGWTCMLLVELLLNSAGWEACATNQAGCLSYHSRIAPVQRPVLMKAECSCATLYESPVYISPSATRFEHRRPEAQGEATAPSRRVRLHRRWRGGRIDITRKLPGVRSEDIATALCRCDACVRPAHDRARNAAFHAPDPRARWELSVDVSARGGSSSARRRRSGDHLYALNTFGLPDRRRRSSIWRAGLVPALSHWRSP